MIGIIGLLILLVVGCVWLEFNDENKKKTEIIEKSILVTAFKNVKIDSTTDNVKFKIGDHYCVTYKGREDIKPVIVVRNETLSINSPSENIIINGSIFDEKQEQQLLTIEMPEKELDSLSIDLSNGSISTDKLSVKNGNIDTSNGNVNIKNLLTKKEFQIDASNGNIRVEKANAKGYDFFTSNGRIFYKGKKITNSYNEDQTNVNTLKISTSNGDITVN